MPVSYIPSAEAAEAKQKQTARKRRRNQNTEIDELAALLPIKQQATIANGIVARGRTQAIDKISVLRITSAFLKFQKYLEKDKERETATLGNSGEATNLVSEALDGFLIVLDSEGIILYVSESITDIVGLTQHDVIGQNMIDIIEEDDAPTIIDALKCKTTPPATHLDGRTELQHRQFYVRIKSSVTPGRMQMSKFLSHVMIQVTGNLKVHVPFQSHMDPKQNGTQPQPEVLGFVAECRTIESTSSILEVSVPQSHFTSTINLDMKIISVEASVKEVIGYDPSDFVGTKMSDYFHPGDCKKLIKCEKALMRLGHAVSPVFRFMTSSGDWVWMQLEGMLRYKQGGVEPQFWEVKAKLLSQEDGKMKYVEYREMYAKNSDPNQNLLCPHKDPIVTACLMDTENKCRKEEGAEPIIDSFQKAQVPSALIDPVLHCRELGLKYLPDNTKRVLTENEADDFLKQRNKQLVQERAKLNEVIKQSQPSANIVQTKPQQRMIVENQITPGSSPVTQPHQQPTNSLLQQGPQQNSYSSQVPALRNVRSPSNGSSISSPMGSGLDEYSPIPHTLTSSHLHTRTSSHPDISPPDSVLSLDQYPANVFSPPSTDISSGHNSPFNQTTSKHVEASLLNGLDFVNTQSVPNFNPNLQNALTYMSQNPAQVQNTFGPNAFTYPPHNSGPANSTTPQLDDANFVHQSDVNLPQDLFKQNATHPLSKTSSLSSLTSSLTSSISSPSLPGTAPSPLSNPISPQQALVSPETDCLGHILRDSSISPEEVFQSTQNDSLEQILNDMISINQRGTVGGGRISVECEVHTRGDLRKYGDSEISVVNSEAEDIIQQFLS